jgi:hypothetical protein
MPMTIEDRKKLIAQLLTPRSPTRADASAFADRALWSWERIAFHLKPLIGEAGFHSLYKRAIHLAGPECAGLTQLRHGSSTDKLFQQLRDDLMLLEEADTQRCSNALLNSFIELVSSMIGDGLSTQILHSAWKDAPHLEDPLEDGK